MGLQGPVGPGNAGFINPVAGSISVNSTTDVVVATLTNLPAGSYLLSGKANIIKTGATANFTTCALKNGATVLDQLQNQTSTSGELSVLSGSVTLAAPATITMTCRVSAASTTMAAQFRVLTAFKVNTLTVQ